VAERDLLASLSLGIFWYTQAGERFGGEFSLLLLRSSDMDAYFRSQELAGARQSWVSVCGQAWLCLANE
jgi:hypothetical protein